jgi:hypothetical protein
VKSFAVKWLRENYNHAHFWGLIIQTIIYEAVIGIKFTSGVLCDRISMAVPCYREKM